MRGMYSPGAYTAGRYCLVSQAIKQRRCGVRRKRPPAGHYWFALLGGDDDGVVSCQTNLDQSAGAAAGYLLRGPLAPRWALAAPRALMARLGLSKLSGGRSCVLLLYGWW